MRCKACDAKLSDFEATRKSLTTGEFLDLCSTCFNYIKEDVYVIENQDNMDIQDIIDIDDDF